MKKNWKMLLLFGGGRMKNEWIMVLDLECDICDGEWVWWQWWWGGGGGEIVVVVVCGN
jgi:hypothetical protein